MAVFIKSTIEEIKERVYAINKNIEILDDIYINSKHKMKCRCLIDGYEWYVHTGNLITNKRGCPRCVGNERFTEDRASQILKSKHYSIEFKDFKYKNNKTKVNCECKICGCNWFPTFASLNNGSGCPVCANKEVIIGLNDIATTRPDLVKYFKNKEDANKYVSGSNLFVDMICPDCGSERKFKISELSRKHFICNSCSEGITIPNKMLFNVLKNSGLSFDVEKSINDTRIRYDGILFKDMVVIECHGKQHYINWTKGKGLEHEQQNDKMKKELAEYLGYKYIEIDCRKSDLDFIKNNIINGLSNLIDFSSYDWNSIYKKCMSSLVVEASGLKSNNQNLTTTDIGNILKISKTTVAKYLRIGDKLGLCHYDAKEEVAKVILANSGKGGKVGKCVLQLLPNGKILNEYTTVKEIIESDEIYTKAMYKIVRRGLVYNGFKWMYKMDYK